MFVAPDAAAVDCDRRDAVDDDIGSCDLSYITNYSFTFGDVSRASCGLSGANAATSAYSICMTNVIGHPGGRRRRNVVTRTP